MLDLPENLGFGSAVSESFPLSNSRVLTKSGFSDDSFKTVQRFLAVSDCFFVIIAMLYYFANYLQFLYIG